MGMDKGSYRTRSSPPPLYSSLARTRALMRSERGALSLDLPARLWSGCTSRLEG